MELYIRSQDKMALAKFDLLILEDMPYSEDKYMFIADHYKNMGVYKTKERTLEILDEIQTHLLKMGKTEMLTNENGIINGIKDYGIVYEMPKE